MRFFAVISQNTCRVFMGLMRFGVNVQPCAERGYAFALSFFGFPAAFFAENPYSQKGGNEAFMAHIYRSLAGGAAQYNIGLCTGGADVPSVIFPPGRKGIQ